jgi:hypothetical protein
MGSLQTFDKETTIQRIKDKYEGRMDLDKFNQRITEADAKQYLIEVAELVEVEVAYYT